MKNKLSDLNNHLFAQLERLSDESMSKEEVQLEINRAQAISKISREVIDNASLVLKAQKLIMDGEVEQKPIENGNWPWQFINILQSNTTSSAKSELW